MIIADPQFAQAFVNRVWGWFFGRGIVNPLDDFSEKNPPIVPELLAALSKKFIRHGYNIRWLIRTIVTSKAYQRSSRRVKVADGAVVKYFGRSRVRPLSPEQLFQSISHATGLLPDKRRGLPGAYLDDDEILGTMGGRNTTRESKKYFVVRSWLISMLLQNSGESAVTNFSKYSANLQQILWFLNQKLPLFSGTRKGNAGTLHSWLDQGWTTDEILWEIYLSTVSRFPTQKEMERCKRHLLRSPSKAKAYEDIFWAMLNSDEFIFNH